MKKSKLRVSLVVMILVIATLFTGCNKKESKEKEYEKGTINEDSFESEFLDIKFTVPEGYSLFSQEVMDQYVQFASEIAYKDKDQKVIDYTKAITVFEMMCGESVTNTPNVNIVVENLIGKKDITVDDYIESSKQQLTSTGFEYTFGDITKDVELAGEKYTVFECVGNYSGQEVLQQLYIRKVADRMMVLTVTYTEDTKEAKDTLLAGFSVLK